MPSSRVRRSLPAIFLLAALSSAGPDALAQQTTDSPPPLGTASFNPPESKRHEPLTPENFVVRAAIANLAEIGSSELALEKSGDKAIRALASHLMNDHRASQAKLKGIARKAKIALPGTVDEDTRKRQETLKDLEGADFDRAYLDLTQTDHAQALELYEQAATANLPASFQSYASETSRIVQAHQTEIAKLRNQQQR